MRPNGQPECGIPGRLSKSSRSRGAACQWPLSPEPQWSELPPKPRTPAVASGKYGYPTLSPPGSPCSSRPPLSSMQTFASVSRSSSASAIPAGPAPTMQTSASSSSSGARDRASISTAPYYGAAWATFLEASRRRRSRPAARGERLRRPAARSPAARAPLRHPARRRAGARSRHRSIRARPAPA
jgi:hypothetical protein